MKSRSVKKSSYQEVMDQINHASKINAEAAARAAEEKAAKEEAESKLNSIYGYTNLASSPNRPKLKRKLEGDDDGDDFEYDEEDDDDDEEEEDVTVIDPPMKRQKVATLGEPWQSSTLLSQTVQTTQAALLIWLRPLVKAKLMQWSPQHRKQRQHQDLSLIHLIGRFLLAKILHILLHSAAVQILNYLQ